MKDAVRQTRSHIMELFEQGGIHPRTDLGQNFLIDLNLIDFVVQAAELGSDDVVLEIGSGTGGMTTSLAHQAAAVVSVEVDSHMFRLAQSATAGLENVTLLHSDALKNKNHFAPAVLDCVQARLAEGPERRLKLVANLPYCIATPVISNLVASDLPWTAMVTTIQLELAERMRAQPSTGDYSALSVWLQSQTHIKLLKRLAPQVFWPRPNVDSAIVRLLAAPAAAERIQDREFFHDFIRRLFHQRRKHLRSVVVGMYRKQLSKSDVDVVMQDMQLKEGVRAEELDVETLVTFSNRLHAVVASQASQADP